jgi:hypothetical protein
LAVDDNPDITFTVKLGFEASGIMQKYNWTQTALHHHLLGESPKILFLHWSVTGNANDLINQAKEIMMQTSTYDDQAPRAPTSAGP